MVQNTIVYVYCHICLAMWSVEPLQVVLPHIIAECSLNLAWQCHKYHSCSRIWYSSSKVLFLQALEDCKKLLSHSGVLQYNTINYDYRRMKQKSMGAYRYSYLIYIYIEIGTSCLNFTYIKSLGIDYTHNNNCKGTYYSRYVNVLIFRNT